MIITNKPTYVADIVGDIKRIDERGIVFARHDLFRYFPNTSSEYADYYRQNPQNFAYDQRINEILKLGFSNSNDKAMFESQFAVLNKISPEGFVSGISSPDKKNVDISLASKKIKALAKILGSDITGICELKQEWVYSHVGRSYGDREGFRKWGEPIDLSTHKYAIALGFHMDQDLMQCAPKFPVLLATAKGYATGAWVSIQLAEYLRQMGYSARAHHFHNYQVLPVPIAVDSGLGELSRAGYLLTKEYGLGLRLAIVTTDMPLEVDRPIDIGVQSFCNKCKICAEQCPTGAIPQGDKVVSNGIRKWKLDEQKCYAYWSVNGTDCGICMVVCPWTKPATKFHQFMAKIASIKGVHQGWMAKAEKIVYGKHKSASPPEFLDANF